MADPKKETLVMKFGGTSVGTPEAIRHTLEIVQQAKTEWHNVVVVTSAFSNVTDALYDSALQAARGNLCVFERTQAMLTERHRASLDELVRNDELRSQAHGEITHLLTLFSSIMQAIHVLGEASARALDTVVSLGERLAVTVLAAALVDAGVHSQAVDASGLIVTDEHFQNAAPLLDLTAIQVRQGLLPLLQRGLVPVITGFLGATASGIRTTLGRGGSDYSAALLGVVLAAGEVWIWTDVSGVMTADPRLAPDAQTIPILSYREVSELAYFGAKVLHPKTIRPVVEAGIPLRVLNTFDRRQIGTLIQQQLTEPAGKKSADDAIIKAVTAVKGVQLITVEGRGMLGVPGVAARIFSAVATTGATVPLITEASSEQSLCFAVPVEMTACVIAVLEKTLAEEIQRRNIDRVWASEEVVIVTAVCPYMRQKLGVAGKIFSALAAHEVNVLAIAHGSSEVSISLVVATHDLEITIQALHNLTRTRSIRPE